GSTRGWVVELGNIALGKRLVLLLRLVGRLCHAGEWSREVAQHRLIDSAPDSSLLNPIHRRLFLRGSESDRLLDLGVRHFGNELSRSRRESDQRSESGKRNCYSWHAKAWSGLAQGTPIHRSRLWRVSRYGTSRYRAPL